MSKSTQTRFGPHVKWRGTIGSREEGLVSISFIGKTGEITRLTLDFESAEKLQSSLTSYLPTSCAADTLGGRHAATT